MALSAGFADFLRDVLSGVGDISIRKMFGGAGVYLHGMMFALVAGDTLYLRADEASAPDFAAEGKGPFTYAARGRAFKAEVARLAGTRGSAGEAGTA